MTSSTPAVHPVRSSFHRLTVAAVDRLCSDAVALTFEVPPELSEQFHFRPGQYLTVRRVIDEVDQRRSYSICAPAGQRPRVGVREVPDGLFSSWLVYQVRAGDQLEVSGPSGSFTPDLAADAHHVLIAAGSGITPMLSIASSVLETNPRSRTTLLYGNRRTETVMFADDLADLKDQYPPRMELAHVLSREPRDSTAFSGRLDAAKLRTLLPRMVTPGLVDHWWLCGPYRMVTDAVAVLAELGVPPERIHQELFFVDEPPEPVVHAETGSSGAIAAAVVILDGRATPLPIGPGQSVLSAAQKVRPDLPFACRGGVCGTCRALLTDGQVRMKRNFALEPAEVRAGFVLTCQSYPLTPTLTVDFDS